MGYAATISWALFVLVFAATLVQVLLQRRWANDG
jgi:ABC-type sugar transport system permease subunit